MKALLTMILLFLAFCGKAQDPSIHPQPGAVTWCPDEEVTFEVRTDGEQQTGCNYLWTVSNGQIVGLNNRQQVKVKFSNIAGTATLSVTLTNCTSATNTTATRTYAIRSLAGRVPTNARANPASLAFCSTSSMFLAVDVMFLNNTGGTTGIPQLRADGYEWELPDGWSASGTSGTVRTPTEFVNIAPDNGCRGGSVTVRAFMNCTSGRKYSSTATIPLTRPSPALSVTAPVGYTGPSCGKIDPVVFTVTPMSCATSYTWVVPPGWVQTSNNQPTPIITTGNSIMLTPSGGAADAGIINVTANLNCNTQILAVPRTLTFSPPVINSPAAICFGGNTVTMTGIAPGVSVQWAVSPNLSIVSGQGSAILQIKAMNNQIRETGTINAAVTCPNTTVPTKNVWVGMPNQIADILKGSGAIAIGATVPFSIHDPSNPNTGPVTYDWDVTGGYFAWIDLHAWTTITEPYLVLYAGSRNACGSLGMISRGWSIENPGGCPPGEICEMSIFPNPSSETVMLKSNVVGEGGKIQQVLLRDSFGLIRYSKGVSAFQFTIPVDKLDDGIYTLTYTIGGRTKTRQIVIRH